MNSNTEEKTIEQRAKEWTDYVLDPVFQDEEPCLIKGYIKGATDQKEIMQQQICDALNNEGKLQDEVDNLRLYNQRLMDSTIELKEENERLKPLI